MSLPAAHRAVLEALDANEPVTISDIMDAAWLVLYRASQTLEELTRGRYVRAVPPGARWELTDTGRAKLTELRQGGSS